jgi:hypothetical protein
MYGGGGGGELKGWGGEGKEGWDRKWGGGGGGVQRCGF